ncbi:MAG: hypothetical protein LC754_07040 [Acidobacteria bacterium]|nr:hypothetical protein [Acidobacteriota bacterium]
MGRTRHFVRKRSAPPGSPTSLPPEVEHGAREQTASRARRASCVVVPREAAPDRQAGSARTPASGHDGS